MLRTRKLSQDTDDIYFYLLQIFNKLIAIKIMKFLVSSRTYNVKLVGASGVGRTCFAERLLTDTFDSNYRNPQQLEGTVVFPTTTGKIAFNISECEHSIVQPNLKSEVAVEWSNMDAFFVMFSHTNRVSFRQCEPWIQTIRAVERESQRVSQRDIPHHFRRRVPIVLVGLICDAEPSRILERDITELAKQYKIPYVSISSRTLQNFHAPFLVLQDILRTCVRNLTTEIRSDARETQLLLLPP